MNYLVSSFDGAMLCEKCFKIIKWVKYKIELDKVNDGIIFANGTSIPFVFSLNAPSENVLKVSHKHDNFYFLFQDFIPQYFHTKIKYKNKEIFLSVSNTINITIDGVLICEENVENIKFSHYETCENLCLIYFSGKRNYLIALQDDKVCFSSYYDECNVSENEKYFMCKLYDSLNHGTVFHIKEKEHSNYLVYLDDEELNLKQEFVPFVFLDCIKAGNFKYCNELLNENLKLEHVDDIKKFFPEFSFYYPINEKTFILINKNTLAGIYEFEIENNLIYNIKEN